MKKRILAFLMSVMMIVTLLPLSVSADDTTPSTTPSVEVEKTAVWTDEANGIAKVTLTVDATDGTTSESSVENTYIVLVLDTSGSMSDRTGLTIFSKTKLKSVTDAAGNFINHFLPKYDDNVKIGIVSYANSATKVSDFSDDAKALNTSLSTLTANGATNIQHGIKTAQDMLASVSDTNAQKIIVVLTDGDPTYSYKGSSITKLDSDNTYNVDAGNFPYMVSGFDYSKAIGNGSDYSLGYDAYRVDDTYTVPNNGVGTVSDAYAAKKAGTTIYSITFVTILDGIWDAIFANSQATMKSVASSGKYYSADSDSAINSIFTDIANDIEVPVMAGTSATVTDPMGEAVDVYIDGDAYSITVPDGDTVTVNTDGNIEWTLGDLEKGTHEMTYYVKFDLDKLNVGINEDVPTNDGAILNYTDHTEEDATQTFEDPVLDCTVYSLSYDANGGSSDSLPETKKYFAGKEVDITDVVPTKDGADFLGWSTNKDATTADYTDEDTIKMSGDVHEIVLYAVWKTKEYTVTYKVDGVQVGDTETYSFGTEVTVRDKFSKEGYTVTDWTSDDVTFTDGKFTMPDEDVVIEATTSINSHTVTYKVDGVQVGDTETYSFGTEVTVRDKFSKEGYTVTDWTSDDVTFTDGKFTMPDEDVVIEATTSINSHTVTYKIVGDHFANDSYKVIENVAYGTALSLIADDMTKQGYTWSGWSGLPATMPDADVVVTGSYGNATDTPYKIEYYFETLSGGFNIDNTETLNLFAETNATVKVEAEHKKSFTGFTFDEGNSNNVLSGTVTADGKLVLKLYYTRNSYKVTYVYETTGITPIGASALPEPATYKYGAEVTVAKKATAPNCNFNGWNVKEGGVAITDGKFTMPANDVVLSGKWEWVVNGTKYTVKHYLETGYAIDKYVLDTTEELLGTPGSLTAAKAKSYKGYTAQKFEQQTIAADGKTVVEIYYKLDKADTYTVTYIVDDEIVGKIEEYEAGDTVTVRKRLPDTQLYKFEGWYYPKSISVKNGKFEMPAEDVIIRGHYEYEGIYIPPITDGYIEVEKVLTAPKGYDGATTFTFEIYKDGTDEDDLYAIMKVKAGESEKLKVAVGTYYIYEVGAEEEGYTLTTGCNAKNNRIRVEGGKTRTVTFKNVYVEEILLEKDDHFGYIIGYPDDTVRPESNITRAEIATIFFRMLTDESRAEYWSQTNDFTDVSRSDWFNNAISTLTNAGILSGYADGSFRPNESITRAELVKIAVAFYGSDAAVDADFNDTEDHWADMFINAAYGLGFVNGYEDGSFRPDQAVTRAEAMKIINRTLGRYPTKNGLHEDMIVWSDNRDRSAWYYADVQEATNSHEYVWAADEAEEWTDILPVRDWAALEKSYSDAYDG